MCQDNGRECDWRVNPFQTIQSWPATLVAVCAECGTQRQLGPRGWSLKKEPIHRWPKVTIDKVRDVDPRQLRMI